MNGEGLFNEVSPLGSRSQSGIYQVPTRGRGNNYGHGAGDQSNY